MQNNPKTELHVHADPKMRIRLQLFWSIVTIIVFSTAKSLRSLRNFFHIQMQSMRRIHFGWSFNLPPLGLLLMKKGRKIRVIVRGRSEQAFCNRPEPKLFLQKNECIIQWIGWKAVTRIVAKYIFRKYNSFTQALKLLDMQKKKGSWTVWKILALRWYENMVWEKSKLFWKA